MLNYLVEPKIRDMAGSHNKWESDLKRDQGIQSKSLWIYLSFSDPTPFCCHSPHQARRARKMKVSPGLRDSVCLEIGCLSKC